MKRCDGARGGLAQVREINDLIAGGTPISSHAILMLSAAGVPPKNMTRQRSGAFRFPDPLRYGSYRSVASIPSSSSPPLLPPKASTTADVAEPVRALVDPQGRGRRSAARLTHLVGGAGGFGLPRQEAGGKWGAATYALRRTRTALVGP
jgi:hypothetical protein